ncbi:O-antigen ligase-like membrane protein [Leeuwenhoekiella aestuarii]|uniref:O-antigen ligase-like membrane protein n=1 Tax=Leeuwenhoekiella aestuarii TaxID=2249426 RepID=A0A4V1KPU6_9FLAO|nr:O-antigen ligase family protein [Leeuwenhoekiella aestuarii]RXG17922.1 O-antigen ligase-like membrane protein [Leeuwenhoekiella aestuarii]RXG19251.1 O-antigen ligase-like membrane protein [Leeuwenhoekiella aestuarii]
MIVSERTYRFSYNAWLIILAVSLIFRVPATILLILFTIFNLVFFKRLKFTRKRLFFILLIASPFLLDLLFFWNNDVFTEGIKHAEKRVSLLLLPLFILSQNHRLNTILILRYYALATTAILSFCLIRFAIISPELFNKYLNGIDLWEMGYEFARSIKMHAPALNLHVAFVVVINFYFFKEALGQIRKTHIVWRFVFFLLSLIVLFYINTRLAIVSVFFGIILVSLLGNKAVFSAKTFKKLAVGLVVFIVLGIGFVKLFPYSIQKFSNVTFAHLDKVGKIDQLENPEAEAFNGLVTRLSIWKSSLEVALKNPVIGVGAADGKQDVVTYFKDTNQQFLGKYKFPVHNQYLDFWIKFGILGLVVSLFYVFLFLYIGIASRQVLCVFFFILFASANFVDDFLIRFDGIVFSGIWLSIFTKNALDIKLDKLK